MEEVAEGGYCWLHGSLHLARTLQSIAGNHSPSCGALQAWLPWPTQRCTGVCSALKQCQKCRTVAQISAQQAVHAGQLICAIVCGACVHWDWRSSACSFGVPVSHITTLNSTLSNKLAVHSAKGRRTWATQRRASLALELSRMLLGVRSPCSTPREWMSAVVGGRKGAGSDEGRQEREKPGACSALLFAPTLQAQRQEPRSTAAGALGPAQHPWRQPSTRAR